MASAAVWIAELKQRASIRRDVQRMVAVARERADEATIFYAARIVEVTSNLVLASVGICPTDNMFESLTSLQHYNLMPPVTRCWAHAVRRLGNDVRHIRQQVSHDNARLSCMMVARILSWCQSWLDKLEPADADLFNLAGEIPTDHDVSRVLEACERASREPCLETLDAYLSNPPHLDAEGYILPAMIEAFMERDTHWLPLVEQRLALCPLLPRSLRLRQLLVLILSRQGKLEQASDLGASLLQYNPDDEESIGIVAGIQKRRWQSDDHNMDALRYANRLYRNGWRASKHRNTYLGVNAAATNVWLDQFDAARTIAEAISGVLLQRIKELNQVTRSEPMQLCVWDTLSLAEALLILGRTEEALTYYQAAFERDSGAEGVMQVARDQATRLLQRLSGPTATDLQFFQPHPTLTRGDVEPSSPATDESSLPDRVVDRVDDL